mgnify:CR=1 FL=1
MALKATAQKCGLRYSVQTWVQSVRIAWKTLTEKPGCRLAVLTLRILIFRCRAEHQIVVGLWCVLSIPLGLQSHHQHYKIRRTGQLDIISPKGSIFMQHNYRRWLSPNIKSSILRNSCSPIQSVIGLRSSRTLSMRSIPFRRSDATTAITKSPIVDSPMQLTERPGC